VLRGDEVTKTEESILEDIQEGDFIFGVRDLAFEAGNDQFADFGGDSLTIGIVNGVDDGLQTNGENITGLVLLRVGDQKEKLVNKVNDGFRVEFLHQGGQTVRKRENKKVNEMERSV
jgi:hypothetical protein